MDFNSFFVNSYPRSGNTWIRLLIKNVLDAHALDLNPVFSTRYRIFNTARYQKIKPGMEKGYIFKSHLMFHKSPQDLKPFKGVYLLRDGRDSLLSYFFYNVKHKGYLESWDQFFERYFLKRKPLNYREKVLLKLMGGWGDNVQSYNKHDNVILCRYEDLLANPGDNIEKIMKFLDIDFRHLKEKTASQIIASGENLNQKAQRDKQERKRGSAGTWRDFYSAEQNNEFIKRYGDTLTEFGYPTN
jgi:hypothetical protein